MAQKIKLGSRPETFKRTVTFPMPGEDVGVIEVTFRYRTRLEFAAFADEMHASAKAESEKVVARATEAIDKGEEPQVTQVSITKRQNEFNVRYLLGAVESWNLDVPFDNEAAEQLADELPSAVTAIMNDYRAALAEGRLGNSGK